MTTVGQPAPDFVLPDEAGETHSLAELRKDGPVVVYFYPKDHTPGCSKQACGFRNANKHFLAEGARVVGISSDNAASHQSFKSRLDLPFLLLTDIDGSVAKGFGVQKTLGVIPGRATYVVGQDGTVQLEYASQLRTEEHVVRALAAVRELTAHRAS